jgi:hypothetical protein
MIATSMNRQDIKKSRLFGIREIRGRTSEEDDIGDRQWA